MRVIRTVTLLSLIIATSCGGGPKSSKTGDEADIQDAKIAAEDLIPRAVLAHADLTTKVDEKRYRVDGPVATEFEPTEPVIHMVAKLRNVPTQAQILVKWFKDSDPSPMLVSEINGSDTFYFISSFKPTDKDFIPGTYSVRIFVHDREVGGPSFTILGDDPFATGTGVKKLAISTKVTRKMKPRKPSRKFKEGTKKVFATFDVSMASPGTLVTVRWLRGNTVFSEQDMEVGGSGRFGADINSPSGLPVGKYTVFLDVDGETKTSTTFRVGQESTGPTVDRLALGLALGPDNLPVKEKTSFSSSTSKIHCGLRFLDAPPDSVITVLWNRVEEDGDSVWHTTKTGLSSGGSGTMGTEWETEGILDPGTYKVVVQINDEPLNELEFQVE